MEACVTTVETDGQEAPTAEIGSVIAPREITLVPVPYVGSEQPVVVNRPAIDEFMATKPA